jgi:6-pyruvoyltetrahydropterin/6-carboxytetrahydropterin synthase
MLFLNTINMTSIIRVTREFSFEMAHVLNVHGHSYRLFVTLAGTPIADLKNPRKGMVMDFSEIKVIVLEKIISLFDHSVAVGSDFDKDKMEMMKKTFGNTVVVDYQPTCENLVADFAQRLKNEMPAGIRLHSLRLYETAKSYAEWYAADNE